MTKKLKGWDSSKLNLNAKYDSKTMQDWIAVLQGHEVPDAEPNNKAFAEAVRYGFKKLYPDRKSKVIKGEYDFERDGDIDEFNARLKEARLEEEAREVVRKKESIFFEEDAEDEEKK